MLKREVQVMQEYYFGDIGKEEEITKFQKIYSVKIHIVTLRELLLFKSIYYSKTSEAISAIVQQQPKPAVFFKSMMELNGANFCSMLAFDSKSMIYLLSDKQAKFFDPNYPVFYQNKHNRGSFEKPKYYFRNSVDIALENNQTRAVSAILDYIIKYQNNYISFFLFQRNFPILLKKGIKIAPILNSKVFTFNFEFFEWPGIHTNKQTLIRDYR